MRATANVEQQSIRRIETDQRSVSVAPIGDRCEQRQIRLRLGIGNRERGMHCARVGKRHAGAQPELCRRIVERRDPSRRLDRSGNGERRLSRRGRKGAAFDPVGRQPSKPNREKALR